MKELTKIYDMCLEHETNLALDVEMLEKKRIKAYESRDKEVFSEILPVLNAIKEDVGRYREYLLSLVESEGDDSIYDPLTWR